MVTLYPQINNAYSYGSILKNGLLLRLCLPIYWVHELNTYLGEANCLIQKIRMESRRYFGREPTAINIPILSNRLIGYFKIVILGQLHLLNLKAGIIIFYQLIHCCNLYYYILYFPLSCSKGSHKGWYVKWKSNICSSLLRTHIVQAELTSA